MKFALRKKPRGEHSQNVGRKKSKINRTRQVKPQNETSLNWLSSSEYGAWFYFISNSMYSCIYIQHSNLLAFVLQSAFNFDSFHRFIHELW